MGLAQELISVKKGSEESPAEVHKQSLNLCGSLSLYLSLSVFVGACVGVCVCVALSRACSVVACLCVCVCVCVCVFMQQPFSAKPKRVSLWHLSHWTWMM